MHANWSLMSLSDVQASVPLLLFALDESFQLALPSTVSAPILDSETRPGSSAQGRAHTVSAKFLHISDGREGFCGLSKKKEEF